MSYFPWVRRDDDSTETEGDYSSLFTGEGQTRLCENAWKQCETAKSTMKMSKLEQCGIFFFLPADIPRDLKHLSTTAVLKGSSYFVRPCLLI